MKKLFTSLLVLSFVLACKNNTEKKDDVIKAPAATEIQNTDNTNSSSDIVEESNEKGREQKFNIKDIQVSEADLGEFPFFSFPEGLTALNKPIQRKFDRLYFPIDGIMTPIEGKVWKTNVTDDDNSGDEWSLPYFIKSYEEAIKEVGGVKIFDGEITYEEYEKYHDNAEYLGEDGSIGYMGQKIKVYVIRQADGGDVYIQFTGDSAGGDLNILQKEPFKQTITILKSDKILKDLENTGKAILYINFDLDKSTLQAKGKDAVAEIAKALEDNESMNVAIHGYTDNSGNDAHNQQLSEARALTVLNALTGLGIDASRLSSKGFGAQNPITENTTEEGRAKNRRVELIKL